MVAGYFVSMVDISGIVCFIAAILFPTPANQVQKAESRRREADNQAL
jgi:hypothetical protein